LSIQRPGDPDQSVDATGMRVALVVARFNAEICERLLEGALECLEQHGARERDLQVVRVPGSFEIPLIARKLAESGAHHAVVCLGALVRGDTLHYEVIAREVCSGIARASSDSGVPITLGVLTTENHRQAEDRAGGKMGNRGADAALAAIEMVELMRRLEL
jgi:6,7-dimethyl-8-ribityllumazine synthase